MIQKDYGKSSVLGLAAFPVLVTCSVSCVGATAFTHQKTFMESPMCVLEVIKPDMALTFQGT